jgi:arylsulfatase A-like enzyme
VTPIFFAGIVEKSEAYRWCSLGYHAQTHTRDKFLSTDFGLRELAPSEIRFAVTSELHKTPNIDRLAREGMMFMDYYAEANCTAGRANFITGMLPYRTGMTTVGQAGSPLGLPAEAPTIATVL